MKTLYFDMDGVLADFEAGFKKKFGVPHFSMPDDEMWKTINADDRFFADLDPMPGAIEFFDRYRGYNPVILTACPKTNYASAAKQKREWVRKHLGPDVVVLPVMGGSNKVLFMHEPGCVLVDDHEKNLGPWNEAGGIGILHKSIIGTDTQLYIYGYPVKKAAPESPDDLDIAIDAPAFRPLAFGDRAAYPWRELSDHIGGEIARASALVSGPFSGHATSALIEHINSLTEMQRSLLHKVAHPEYEVEVSQRPNWPSTR